jgi:hypothetical protein
MIEIVFVRIIVLAWYKKYPLPPPLHIVVSEVWDFTIHLSFHREKGGEGFLAMAKNVVIA